VFFNPQAVASDTPRNFLQAVCRKLANAIIKTFKLNKPGMFRTEFCQMLEPIITVSLDNDKKIIMDASHGRLVWRAKTLFSEEPETIKWLDTLTRKDVFWDVGANVGLYSIYAAVRSGCKVIAFEPEPSNFSILLKNIYINNLQKQILPFNAPLSESSKLGLMHLNSLTKGGAFNKFCRSSIPLEKPKKSLQKVREEKNINFFCHSIKGDSLSGLKGITLPTFLKIDVDGAELSIIRGINNLLKNNKLKNILIEIEDKTNNGKELLKILNQNNYVFASKRSNWQSKNNPIGESFSPGVNYIFKKKIKK
jgi:FkbM family methyltransferase